jgi:hypothetical protein
MAVGAAAHDEVIERVPSGLYIAGERRGLR